MGGAVIEGPVDGGPERGDVDLPRGREQREVGKVLVVGASPSSSYAR
jgi:hypothetical protein